MHTDPFTSAWLAFAEGEAEDWPAQHFLDAPAALVPLLDGDAGTGRGWRLDEGIGSTSGPMQIVRLDYAGECEPPEPQLDDDTDAWMEVLSLAAAGEQLGRQVLDLVLLTNPIEYLSLMAWQGSHELPAAVDDIENSLEYMRTVIRSGAMSYGEIAWLQGMVEHIDPGDVELLEWAGVPEFPDHEEAADG